MSAAKRGDAVKVHYTGKLDDGTVFDSSEGREPLDFVLGEGQVIAGFDTAVDGMAAGDTKTVKIPADEAYGAHNPELIHKVGRDRIPNEIELEVGGQLQVEGQDGRAFAVTISDMNDEEVTLDANHPLAGQDLTFDLELVSAG